MHLGVHLPVYLEIHLAMHLKMHHLAKAGLVFLEMGLNIYLTCRWMIATMTIKGSELWTLGVQDNEKRRWGGRGPPKEIKMRRADRI